MPAARTATTACPRVGTGSGASSRVKREPPRQVAIFTFGSSLSGTAGHPPGRAVAPPAYVPNPDSDSRDRLSTRPPRLRPISAGGSLTPADLRRRLVRGSRKDRFVAAAGPTIGAVPLSRRPQLDDPCRGQAVDLIMREPELFEHLLRVLAEERSRAVDARRSARRARGETEDLQSAGARLIDLLEQLEVLHLRIVEHLVELVHRPRGDGGRLQSDHPLGRRRRR